MNKHLSIHAPAMGGDTVRTVGQLVALISIHAPREGGDGCPETAKEFSEYISIHAPREGGDSKNS